MNKSLAAFWRSVSFAALAVPALSVLACGKSEPSVVVVPDDKKVDKAPPATASAPLVVEPWAEPATLCVHTVAVCDENEQCNTRKQKLNAAGIYAYQLFDKECVKWVTKRQTVLGAGYPACAACLRDAKTPKEVQDCMFEGGVCHGTDPQPKGSQ